MAETIEYREEMFYAISAAKKALEGVPNVWVSGNDFIYYVEGKSEKRVSPDCYIVLDVLPKTTRPFFKVWEENGRTPNVVWEFTSRDTARADRETKFVLYEQVLKVREYFLFDPLDQYLKPRLQGYRLTNGAYQPIVPDADGRLLSSETGIKMFADGALLRFVHPRTGEVLSTYEEMDAQNSVALSEAVRERERREAAEAEVARLRAELERLAGTP